MDEPVPQTVRDAASVFATTMLSGDFQNVHDLERARVEATRAAGRQLYVRAFIAFQEAWLAQRRPRDRAQALDQTGGSPSSISPQTQPA